MIVIYTKFAEGAWIVTVAIPVLVLGMLGDQAPLHALRAPARVRARLRSRPRRSRSNTTILARRVAERCDRARRRGSREEISPDGFRAVHVPTKKSDPGIRPRWFRLGDDRPQLEVLDPERGPADAVLEQVWRLPRGEADFVTVVIPELFQTRSVARPGCGARSSSR